MQGRLSVGVFVAVPIDMLYLCGAMHRRVSQSQPHLELPEMSIVEVY